MNPDASQCTEAHLTFNMKKASLLLFTVLLLFITREKLILAFTKDKFLETGSLHFHNGKYTKGNTKNYDLFSRLLTQRLSSI